MKVLVCGGRYFGWNYEEMRFIKNTLFPNIVSPKDTLISGEADGTDLMAKFIAKIRIKCAYKGYPAAWNKYGRAAGPIRNTEMLECNPDIELGVAFPGGKGTSDMITKLKNENIEVIEPAYHIPYKELEAERKGKDFPWPLLKTL